MKKKTVKGQDYKMISSGEDMLWRLHKAGRNLNVLLDFIDFLAYKFLEMLFPLPGIFHTHMPPAQLSSFSPYSLNLSLNFAFSWNF